MAASFCSSDSGGGPTTNRKTSIMTAKDEEEEETVVDIDVRCHLEDFRDQNLDADRSEILSALSFCKTKLKEFLNEEKNVKRESEETCNNDDEVEDLNVYARAQQTSKIKQMYLDKIVQLGLELQESDDKSDEVNREPVVRKNGHEFVCQPSRGRHNPCCEVCMHTIWRLVQTWRRCRVCGLRAHEKCTEETSRQCSGLIAARPDFRIETEIAEEKSLVEQDFKCAECFAPLNYDGSSDEEPRLCDYTGELYCPRCHWNDQWSIPARIVHNLDATPRPVCRAVKQLLSIVESKPLVKLTSAQFSLIKFHKELRRVSELRRNFLLMKCYFVSCREARRLRILQYLHKHSHFVENADVYSIKELRELCNGILLAELEEIHEVFRKHIEQECETCKGNGFYCELCENGEEKRNEILYPFTPETSSCSTCLAIYHKKCFSKRSMQCPRCERRRKRKEKIAEASDAS